MRVFPSLLFQNVEMGVQSSQKVSEQVLAPKSTLEDWTREVRLDDCTTQKRKINGSRNPSEVKKAFDYFTWCDVNKKSQSESPET